MDLQLVEEKKRNIGFARAAEPDFDQRWFMNKKGFPFDLKAVESKISLKSYESIIPTISSVEISLTIILKGIFVYI